MGKTRNYEIAAPGPAADGYSRLMVDVLVQAVNDYVTYIPTPSGKRDGDRNFVAARSWIFDKPIISGYVFSFARICAYQKISVSKARAEIRKRRLEFISKNGQKARAMILAGRA